MSDKYSICVRGKRHEWAFTVKGTAEAAEDWRADGLDVVKLEYTIPGWVVDSGLAGLWMAGADAMRWLRS